MVYIISVHCQGGHQTPRGNVDSGTGRSRVPGNSSSSSSNVGAASGLGLGLGLGLGRTASLEALSLLDLPHLQGMANLAVLGLGPATPFLPTGAAAAGTAAGGTASAGASGSGLSVGTLAVKVRLVASPCAGIETADRFGI